MRSVIFFAALAAAAPLLDKRDVVLATTTEEVVQTIWSTTTLWVEPSASKSAPAGFFETHPTPAAASSPSSAPAVSSSTPTPTPAASSSAPPPPPPTSSAAPPPVQQPPAVPAPAVPAPQPAAASSGQGQYSGDITYYDVSPAAGSCGRQGSNSEMLVALSSDVMANGANPNANPKCGKTINIYYGGSVHSATVYDTCPTCSGGSIDLTEALFKAVAPNGDGRVHDVSWSFA